MVLRSWKSMISLFLFLFMFWSLIWIIEVQLRTLINICQGEEFWGPKPEQIFAAPFILYALWSSHWCDGSTINGECFKKNSGWKILFPSSLIWLVNRHLKLHADVNKKGWRVYVYYLPIWKSGLQKVDQFPFVEGLKLPLPCLGGWVHFCFPHLSFSFLLAGLALI